MNGMLYNASHAMSQENPRCKNTKEMVMWKYDGKSVINIYKKYDWLQLAFGYYITMKSHIQSMNIGVLTSIFISEEDIINYSDLVK